MQEGCTVIHAHDFESDLQDHVELSTKRATTARVLPIYPERTAPSVLYIRPAPPPP